MRPTQQNETLASKAKAGVSAAGTAIKEKFKTKGEAAEFILGKGLKENFAGDENGEKNILGGIRKIGLLALTIVAAVIAAPFVGPAIAAIGCIAGMALLRNSDNFTKTQAERAKVEADELAKKSPKQIEVRQEELEKQKNTAKYFGIAAAVLLALVLFAPAAPIIGALIGLVGPTTLGLGATAAVATSFFVSRDAEKKLEKIENFVTEKEQATAKAPVTSRVNMRASAEQVSEVDKGAAPVKKSPSELEMSEIRSAAAGLKKGPDAASLGASSSLGTGRSTGLDRD